MNLFRSCAVAMALSTALMTLPAQAQTAQDNISGDPMYTADAPPAYAMIGDLLIARPLLIAATAIGAAAFVVALPFTATGGGIGATGRALVVEPAKAAFVRCLGCTKTGYNNRD